MVQNVHDLISAQQQNVDNYIKTKISKPAKNDSLTNTAASISTKRFRYLNPDYDWKTMIISRRDY